MRHDRVIAATLALALAGSRAGAQRSSQATVLGTWRGASTCLVHPSPCRDEVVVYRITPTRSADSVSFDARKVVGGQEEEMGVLGCRVSAAEGSLTCVIPRGTWAFRVRGDSLVGELRLADGTKFRDVRTTRGR